jgi:hypothetical protein
MNKVILSLALLFSLAVAACSGVSYDYSDLDAVAGKPGAGGEAAAE